MLMWVFFFAKLKILHKIVNSRNPLATVLRSKCLQVTFAQDKNLSKAAADRFLTRVRSITSVKPREASMINSFA
jgi:hypothetical protein